MTLLLPFFASFFYEAFVFDLLLFFLLAAGDDLMTHEVPADEAVTDPIVASEEK